VVGPGDAADIQSLANRRCGSGEPWPTCLWAGALRQPRVRGHAEVLVPRSPIAELDLDGFRPGATTVRAALRRAYWTCAPAALHRHRDRVLRRRLRAPWTSARGAGGGGAQRPAARVAERVRFIRSDLFRPAAVPL
jgi:hypothetical protein